ncbi:MAG: PLP-dependent transferase [Flavobacteriaceae bacterium]|nr:PLP-dependent transferase [Flavobacteriaceae bacterium]
MNKNNNVLSLLEIVIKKVPNDWLDLTTHRLDIYNEDLAKVAFLESFEKLLDSEEITTTDLQNLPTAYDYIRLGHPLSSVLEWGLASINGLRAEQVISFSSKSMPVLAVLRNNALHRKNTLLVYTDKLPSYLDTNALREIYGYSFETLKVDTIEAIPEFKGSVVFMAENHAIEELPKSPNFDFYLSIHKHLGSIFYVVSENHISYISEIQHVRRRESIAMTPADSFNALKLLLGQQNTSETADEFEFNKEKVTALVQEITGTNSDVLLGSCGLSVQYAIMMGLIDEAKSRFPGKEIKFIVPPNCYGGTNDQARRVASITNQVEVMDLPVDGDNDMVKSTAQVLDRVAELDAIPYIIAEIPTNPRVEVPDLEQLRMVLTQKRLTKSGEDAVAPVFILDQTFCPNVQFLSKDGLLASVQSIAYVSGSKFPSGGKCTAGYCVANETASRFMPKIEKHFQITNNEATALQTKILAEQLPSMKQRIAKAYENTTKFVDFIRNVLPQAKINFVPDHVVEQGFTPSVFSLDLPTKGKTEKEREVYKRALNKKLITMMISQIKESKHCVSYGQLKGCYWTIPATSTQGTTREEDKDYIARVSVSPDFDLEKHKAVFIKFMNSEELIPI